MQSGRPGSARVSGRVRACRPGQKGASPATLVGQLASFSSAGRLGCYLQEKISGQAREMPDLGPFPPLSTGPTPVLLSFTACVPSHRFPTNSPYASGYHSAACKHSVLEPGPHTLPPHKSREPGTQAHPQMTAARPGP